MSIQVYPEYLSYNPCTVTIKIEGDEYVISNILTKGIPSDRPQAHLESVQINSSKVGSDNPNDYGASGTVTLVDYKNAVFYTLLTQMNKYLKSNNQPTYLSHIKIKIDCFTGSRVWEGEIQEWGYQFVGTTPSITLTWTSIPSSIVSDTNKLPGPGSYTNPKDLIDKVKSACDPKFDMVDIDGNDISDKLIFINGEIGEFNLKESNKSDNNALLTYYNMIIKNCTFDAGTKAPLVGSFENGKYVVRNAEPELNTENTEEGKVVQGIVFIQNSSLPYYTESPANDKSRRKYVIPMTSFSYDAKQSNVILQSRVFNNINGNYNESIAGGQGQNACFSSGYTEVSSENKAQAATGPSGIVVSFECYNVLSFSMNNINEQVEYIVYDEFGNESILSGKGTVTEVSYELGNSGVVKAKVTASEYFNKAETTTQGTPAGASAPGTPDPAVSSSNASAASNMSLVSSNDNQSSSSSDSSSNQDNAKQEKDESGLAYNIACEDAKPIPLSADKTEQLLNNGDFTLHVNEFFDAGFGDLKGTARKIKDSYVKRLIDGGNFGLVALLIAVANYGITGTTVSKWSDPALSASRNATLGHYSGSAIGKAPFDRQTGGLGIAHWDSGNLGTIYADIGMPVEFKNISGFKELLTDNSKHPGKVTGWKDGTYKNEPRCFPVTGGGKCDWRLFDKGLKSNSMWQKWAEQLLNYKGPNGRIYQIYLFELWVKKFWIPTIKKLSKTTSQNGHVICVQDAIRLSRMANSANQLMYDAAGKTVAQQLEIYKKYRPGKADRYEAQFAFCQRASYVAGKLYQKY